MSGPQPFLRVQQSALQRRWRDRLDAALAREAEAIAATHGLSLTLARVLAGRGVETTTAEAFLAPRLRDLMPDPDVMIDCAKAVERLVKAIMARERVAIFGDYDVDGACSSALMAGVLRAYGLDPLIHIPDRLTEGYGPNIEAIRALRDKGATLLLTLDCGTSGHGPLEAAAKLGMDVVVIDHHQAGETVPAVHALVNPNRQDDLSGLGHLCAAGVVFLVLVALNRAMRGRGEVPDLITELDLVALATVADVVPLKGLNRAFVAQGLKVMRSRGRIGLSALADAARLDSAPEAWHLGYLIGPRINAGGRVGDAALGARLLLTRDTDEARRIAGELDQLNRERQTIEEGMLIEAEEQALRSLGIVEDVTRAVIVASGETWHPGVVGIIAGRLKERFNRPAFAIAEGNEAVTGSGRSIEGVDLGSAVRAAVEAGVAIKGGGHAMAAGVTLPPGGVDAFASFLETRLEKSVAAAREAGSFAIDAALTAESLTPDFVTDLQRAGPFGQGNPEPVIALPMHRLAEIIELRGGHLKAIAISQGGARIEAMAFRAGGRPLGDALQRLKGRDVHLAGTLGLDHWGGRPKVTFRITDIAAAS